MALAKGLGGGFPVGACLATERAAQFMVAGTHGSTFGGNPLAMSAANAVLDVMLADGFNAQTCKIADYFWAQLTAMVAKHPKVFAEVRGKGLMIGLKCVVTNSDVIARAFENGLLMVAGGDNVVRLLPSLLITEAEAEAAVAILDRTATELAA